MSPGKRGGRGKSTPRARGAGAAAARGRKLAGVVFAARSARWKTRARAPLAAPVGAPAPGAPGPIPAATLSALGPAAFTGLLIAEGDSWFDYPLHDVLSVLEDDFGFDVRSAAHRGDRVEDMAYSGGQFDDLSRLLEKVLREGRVPDAILLSGGGNDIAGDDFRMLLNHAASGLPVLNADVVRGVIGVRLRDAYAFLIGGLTELAQRLLGRPIPILTHGYDYPIPDGRGFLGGFGPFPGPWLEPGFHQKGYPDQAKNARVMRDLIDAFNDMLKGIGSLPQFAHVRYVDLRDTLASDATYKRDWANEFHPTSRGFSAVTAKIASAIARQV